ncbi:MAG: hypothetical protein J6Q75_07330 [Bacteroidaceae bacterium]|nr:hypothetical protein [Bacteroidaceae bacterium]
MAIRYDEKLNKQILKTVRNFNAKVSRLERQGVQLPVEKVSVREIKKDFTNRRDLLSYMRELRKFSQRGVERIAYIDRWENPFTVYEFKVGGIRQRRAIREAERLLAEARETKRTEGGIPGDQSLMGTDYAATLEANLEKLKGERFHQKRLTSEKKAKIVRAAKATLGSKKYQFAIKDNFYRHLSILGESAGLPASYTDEIISGLKQVNGKDFEKIREAEELIDAIENYYPQWKNAKTKQQRQQVGETVRPLIISLHDNLNQILKTYGYEEVELKENPDGE